MTFNHPVFPEESLIVSSHKSGNDKLTEAFRFYIARDSKKIVNQM